MLPSNFAIQTVAVDLWSGSETRTLIPRPLTIYFPRITSLDYLVDCLSVFNMFRVGSANPRMILAALVFSPNKSLHLRRGRLYERALSLRKMLFRRQALSLLDGTVSKPFRKGGVSHAAARSARNPRDQHSSRAILSLDSYSNEKAEHLGVPVMTQNPFRDEMVLR